jgi:hypothetical protein
MNNLFAFSILQRFFIICLLLSFCNITKITAQTTANTTSDTTYLESYFIVVDINISQYLELDIQTGDFDRSRLVTSQKGEYKNAVVLSSTVRNDSLLITDPFNPTFTFPQDKLSTHKVIDGKATLYLPKAKNLVINSQAADINIKGNYKHIFINQLSGSCTIKALQGDLNYISVYAHVFLNLDHYLVKGFSRSGEVVKFDQPEEVKYVAKIETISGKISNLKKLNK